MRRKVLDSVKWLWRDSSRGRYGCAEWRAAPLYRSIALTLSAEVIFFLPSIGSLGSREETALRKPYLCSLTHRFACTVNHHSRR